MDERTKQIEDFGERIGGAKKELWSARGLYAADIENMNEREAAKHVKKDNIWKKPDYQALLDSGVPLGVVYFIKKARDSLNASPVYRHSDNTPELRLVRQKEYIETVRLLQSAVENIRSVDDALGVYGSFFRGGGFIERVSGSYGPRDYVTEKGRNNPTVTNKLYKTLSIPSASAFDRLFTKKAEREQFGVAKDQKVPAGYSIELCERTGYFNTNDMNPGTYYVALRYRIIADNFKTHEEALQYAQAHAKQRSKSGKVRFVPQQLENIQRTGPDFRNGQEITGQHYLDTFGFRGGEYGNWMSQKDRQASLNMGFEALKDLAATLQISDRDVAFQGRLAIAFGARGSGNAAAHYEPLRQVINLTKMHGAGSLAHEWWHALDDYLGQKMGAEGMLSKEPHRYPLFDKLIETMKFRLETPQQAAERTEKRRAAIQKDAAKWADGAILPIVRAREKEDEISRYVEFKAAYLAGTIGSAEQLNQLYEDMMGRELPANTLDMLHNFEDVLNRMQGEPMLQRTTTDFYNESRRMGEVCEKDGGYWDSNVEMTARAFACYLMDKLPHRSDYLVGHAESAIAFDFSQPGETRIIKAYPQGDERKAINAVFDEIIADLKLQRIMEHTDVTHPLERKGSVLEQLSLLAPDAAEKKPRAHKEPVR